LVHAAKGFYVSDTPEILSLLLEAGADVEAVDEVRMCVLGVHICVCAYVYAFVFVCLCGRISMVVLHVNAAILQLFEYVYTYIRLHVVAAYLKNNETMCSHSYRRSYKVEASIELNITCLRRLTNIS
jgi:hypothetical protein